MAEIRCVCGRMLPIPAKSDGFVRCTACDAQHAVPAESGRRWLVGVLAVVTTAAVGILLWRVFGSSSKPAPEPAPVVGKDPLAEARELKAKGKIGQAVVRYERIIAQDPSAIDARLELGEIYHHLGYHEKAVPHLRAAHESGRRAPELLVSFGESLLLSGARAEAIEVLSGAVRVAPGARAATALGDAYMDSDRLEEAAAAYAGVLKSEPANAGALRRLCRSLLLQGKLAEVEELARTAPGRLPEEPRAFISAHMEAEVLREKGELEKALTRLEQTLKPGPYWADLARLKAQLLMELRRFEDAMGVADAILKASQSPDRIVIFSDAGFLFVEAMLLRPDRAEARKAAAAVLDHMKDFALMTVLQETIQPLLLVAGRGDKERYLKMVGGLPRRAHNDHYLFLAALARADGSEAEFKRHLAAAKSKTIGRNYPHYLIEALERP